MTAKKAKSTKPTHYTIKLTRTQARLLLWWLDAAFEKWASHSCNDPDEEEEAFVRKSPPDWQAFCAYERKVNGKPDPEWPEPGLFDTSFLEWLIHIIKHQTRLSVPERQGR